MLAPTERQHRRGRGCAWGVGIALALLLGALAWRIATVGFLHAVGIGLKTHAVRFTFTAEAYAETQARAAAIVAALDRWRRTHGEYPFTLEELVPSELPAIELPRVGEGMWHYQRRTPTRFHLKFFVGSLYEGDSYDSNEGTWYVDR